MKTVHYKGFNNCDSSCKYIISKINDKYALVFYTDKLEGTSVTNMIEEVTNQVLGSELPQVSPKQIRVFEHYSSELKPIWDWMEVTFEGFTGGKQKEKLLKRLKNKVFSIRNDESYYVYNPSWLSVSEADIEILKPLIK